MRKTCAIGLVAPGISLVVGVGACASREGGIESSGAVAPTPTAAGNRMELPKCPVMENEPIDLAIYTKTNEGRVYFCCKDCIAKYKANPAKYAEKVAAQRQALSEQH